MPLWAGIDEAGYGPQLGPLVVAGTAFFVSEPPRPGMLWDALKDAVVRSARGQGSRVMVNDSKVVYSGVARLKRLEEGVLAFLHSVGGPRPWGGGDLLAYLSDGRPAGEVPGPWFHGARDLALPLESNISAVESKAALLDQALAAAYVKLLGARACVVHAPEYNRVCGRTRNKSLLLWQKCGLLLQEMWRMAGPGESHVVIDRHGGRMRYRRLLRDAFPDCRVDILGEADDVSAYRVADGDRSMLLTFATKADAEAMPTALASMTAKYLRELYMKVFNDYWVARMPGLKPTAGYAGDGMRFLRDIAPVLARDGVLVETLLRCS